MNHTTATVTAAAAGAAPAQLSLPSSLPEMLSNLTLGMLIGDLGLMQFLNATSATNTVSNLSDQLTEHLLAQNDGLVANLTSHRLDEVAAAAAAANNQRDSLMVLLPVTVCYVLIFVAGLLGNVITCTVISRNKTMHTATNYYLFNLAISDLMLLMCGLPVETYNIWFPDSYPVNQSMCILQGLLSETSTNATVLTITSFTVERYIAICHPFRQHTMSKLSRAIRFIMAIWIVAFCLAIPQACQFGVVVNIYGGSACTVKNVLVEHAFEVSSFVFFVGPMTLICVLYVLIGIKLHKSKLLQGVKRRTVGECGRNISGQTRVIRMLVAVAVAFFLCWAPFHAQRVMAVYGKATQTTNHLFRNIYLALTYVSGVLYFLSTCINPLLYSIMSHKFRDAFKTTLARQFGLRIDHKKSHTYSALSKCGNGNGSIRLTATMLAGGGCGAGGVPPTQRHTNIMHTTSLQQPHLYTQHQQRPQHLHQHPNLHFRDVPSGAEHATIIVHRAPLAPHDDDDDIDAGTKDTASMEHTFIAVAAHASTAHHPPTSHHQHQHHNNQPHSHCLIHSRCPHHSYQRHRCISVSSQATLLTNVGSNGSGGGHIPQPAHRPHNDALSASQLRLDQTTHSVVALRPNGSGSEALPNVTTNYNGTVSSSGAISRPPVTDGTSAAPNGKTMTNSGGGGGGVAHRKGSGATKSTLGSIAEKLRRGTRKVLLFTSSSAAATAAKTTIPGPTAGHNVADVGTGQAAPTLQKHNSIDSGGTNTISNSSLQEVDAEEFDSAELARHMGEINNEINAMKYSAVAGNVPTAATGDV